MGFDILLAIAAALVAIYGIAKDLKASTRRVLIGLALLIALVTTGKAYFDNRDKDLMKAALVGTLVPTPGAIATMYKLIDIKAREMGYRHVDYMRVDDGMVLYLNKSAGSSEAVVLDQLDIAKLYAQILMEEGSGDPEKWLWRQIPELGYRPAEERLIFAFLTQSFGRSDFDETNYSESLYGRLCILAKTSIRQVLRRHENDCHYDDRSGVTVTFDIDGKLRTLNVPADRVTQQFIVEGANSRTLFAQLDTKWRGEVEKLKSEAH